MTNTHSLWHIFPLKCIWIFAIYVTQIPLVILSHFMTIVITSRIRFFSLFFPIKTIIKANQINSKAKIKTKIKIKLKRKQKKFMHMMTACLCLLLHNNHHPKKISISNFLFSLFLIFLFLNFQIEWK